MQHREFLHIDMGWGIRNVRPEALTRLAPEIEAPAQIRRIRRYLHVAVFETETPHRRNALARLQRGYPTKISARLGRERHSAQAVSLRPEDAVQIELKEAGMKANKRDCRNGRREVAEKDLKLVTIGEGILDHRLSTRDEIETLLLLDERPTSDRVPIEAEEEKALSRNQRRLLVIHYEADFGEKAKRHLEIGEALLLCRTDDQNVVEIEDASHPLGMKEGLERLRHARENQGGETETERQNEILVKTTPPTESEKTSKTPIHLDVKIGVLQVYRRCPIAWTEEIRCVLNRIHPEVRRIQELLVEPLQIDDGAPPAVFLWNDEDAKNLAGRSH